MGKAILCAAVLFSIVAWRFVQTAGLDLPPWVDSVHHTLAVRLLLEQKSLPETWGPYLPSVPFYYHFGFHVTAALFAQATGLTGLELGRAVLYVGQLWQGALALAVLLLARRVLRSTEQGVAAALLLGFVSTMPAFYLSWGRYTLLAGVTLLAFAIAAAAAERWILLLLLVAAIAVTHYYAFFLLLAFLGMLFVATPALRRRGALAAATVGGVLLASPWILRVYAWNEAMTRTRAPMSGAGGSAAAPLMGFLGPARNYVLLSLAAFGLASLLCKRMSGPSTHARAVALAFGAWSLLLAALTGPWHIGPFRPDHAAIVLFLPAAPLAARGLWQLLPRPLAWTALASLVVWGATESRRIVHPDTVIARADDLDALEWIERSTPADATLLVDVEPWMGLWRGANGGWWAMPLTGRRTVPPPVAYSWGAPELSALVRQVGQRIYDVQRMPQEHYCAGIERLLEETGAGYYYTRATRVADCAQLELVYRGPRGVHIAVLSP